MIYPMSECSRESVLQRAPTPRVYPSAGVGRWQGVPMRLSVPRGIPCGGAGLRQGDAGRQHHRGGCNLQC